jgi:serine/threonine protein kinase
MFKDDRLYLITELMDADITQILPQLTKSTKIQITRDVACAVAFLHSFSPPIMHRDLKPSNVLISKESGSVKLTDFGVSRLDNANTTNMTRDAGTLLYMAPEIFASNSGYGTSADVYSFGLLTVEVWTGENPFAPHEFNWILDFMEKIRTQEVMPGVDRLPEDCPDVIKEIVKSATGWIPESRPSMDFIKKRLTSTFAMMSKKSLPMPKSSNLFSQSFSKSISSSQSGSSLLDEDSFHVVESSKSSSEKGKEEEEEEEEEHEQEQEHEKDKEEEEKKQEEDQ